MATYDAREKAYMARALLLAERGRGRVEPNPMVGCVLVRKGRIVGEGWHRKYGGPHAEVHALRSAGAAARGATAYVTLEPCCHYGKTPPCTKALIEAGVARVVAAMRDPFPPVRGRGGRMLRAAGIPVSFGLGLPEAVALNGAYLKRQATGRPWVILKWAQSLDGRIATRTGDSKWISGRESRALAHRLRGVVDAVIVGASTVLADDPLLTCREGRPKRTATRMVIDPRLRTPPTSQLARSTDQGPVLIVTRPQSLRSPRARALRDAGVELLSVPRAGQGLDLAAFLAELGRRGMANVMVEGGGRTLGAFFDAGFADEAVIFVSHRLIGGGEAVPALGGLGPASMADLAPPVAVRHGRCGEDDVYRLTLTNAAGFLKGPVTAPAGAGSTAKNEEREVREKEAGSRRRR